MKRHTLIQDTREQLPLDFYHPDIRVIRGKLNCGDYGFIFRNGIKSPVIFERKSLSDLFGTMTKGQIRFHKEMSRAVKSNKKLIIIVEGTINDIKRGCRHSKVQGHSILKTLFTIWVKYGIIPIFVRGKQEASEFILHYYMAVWRKMEAGYEEEQVLQPEA